MEKDVNQLLQEGEKVTREAMPGRYQKMLDSLVRKSKKLCDALQNAGGAQYAELQALQALVLNARAANSRQNVRASPAGRAGLCC